MHVMAFMKKLKLSFLAILLVGAVACKKTGTSPTQITVSEAVDIMSGSLSRNSNGLANIGDDAGLRSQKYIDSNFNCGFTRKDTSTRTSAPGSSTTYSYGFGYSYTSNCNTAGMADNITGKLNYTGTFSNPHLSSTNTGNVSFTVAGFSTTATAYVFNGILVRNGSFASKTDTTNHGTIHLSVEIHNLMLLKPHRNIVGGNATFTLTGTIPKKGAFSFTGTVVFNTDGTAKITIAGTAYTVDLTSGEKHKD
ncbi:MAG: hypothetical protein JWP94_1617 [Mucilaginibacter sp.]|nr:hypothetical protein [Mucilaginibacter sp.]